MKVRNQLLVIFLSAIGILLITTFVLLSDITKKNNVLLEAGYADLKKEATKVVDMKSSVLGNWVYDNSFWNELVATVKQKDTAWFENNLIPGMEKFNSDAVWVMDAKGSIFYSIINGSTEVRKEDFFMDIPLLYDSLQKKPFTHFYAQINNEVLEVYTAPIQVGTDNLRITKANGYLIAAQFLNKNYLQGLGHVSEKALYQLMPANTASNDKIIKDEVTINHYIPLHGFNSKTLKLLKITKKMEVLAAYKKDLLTYLLIFIAVVVAIAIALYIYFKGRIISPLNALSIALELKKDTFLDKLKPKKNEFGELAGLISNFFKQNDLLTMEINTRIASEEALKKAASELEKATIDKIRAEQAHLAKTEFLSTMSHEIRTPINGVIGVCNLLMEEKLTKQQREYVNILNFSSRHLLSVVSDILDFSKIESGNFQFEKTSFDLLKTCRNMIELYEPRAVEKHIQLVFEPEAIVPFSLHGDSVRLCQIITNLLNNAIKFTHKGTVSLGYKTISETTAQTTLEFTVKDTGIGISHDKMDAIFEKFTQADISTSSNYGGTGLGLTISKKLVELQGGKMVAKSELGKGSTFTFYLSFEKHVYVDNLPLPGHTKYPKNLQGLKVLVAEDNKINAQVLSGFLRKWQVNFEIVGNGSEVVQKLAFSNYDLILMDLQMPVMDGKEATLKIRNEKATDYCNIPIIALTADATSETQSTIDQYGFSQYLAKPFNPDALFRLLKKYYDIHTN